MLNFFSIFLCSFYFGFYFYFLSFIFICNFFFMQCKVYFFSIVLYLIPF